MAGPKSVIESMREKQRERQLKKEQVCCSFLCFDCLSIAQISKAGVSDLSSGIGATVCALNTDA